MSENQTLQIETAGVFEPLLAPSRYKGARGGRGSGKSHFMAELTVEEHIMYPGLRTMCVREVQKSLKESIKRLLEDKIESLGVQSYFNVLSAEIQTPGDGVIVFQGMQDHTKESIKSFEGFNRALVEEAQTLSAGSLEMLRPTIRNPGPTEMSELRFVWNPRNASDPVDMLFCGMTPPPDAICVRANYNDNPWFPKDLEEDRAYDAIHNRERYGHIWLGEYEPQAIGAIWDRLVLHNNRRTEPPTLGKIVVAVDHAVSSEDGSNEHGIIVAGLGDDNRGYVLDDVTMKGGPRDWASRVVATFDRYEADSIIIERNQGGDLVRDVLKTVRMGLPIVEVTATRGKHVRAEPIAALYAAGKVSHIGTFTKLEDQMCLITAAGYEGEGSPDRVDALVWALTNLFPPLVRRIKRVRSVPEGAMMDSPFNR